MPAFNNIKEYHQFLASSADGCQITLQYYLSQIDANKHLNAFIEVFADEALASAQRLDEKRNSGAPIGKLHGVIIAIKDVICYKNHKASAASNMLKEHVSIYTASALQYLIDEEAIIIGRSNCDEFAMGSSNEHSAFGNVLNAADNSRVPGGSSGGSAVAVQAGMCMISVGTDTGGSVRQPADFCGIIGFKPSYGGISRYGLIAYASSFDQIGILGSTINDIVLVYNIMSKPDQFDSTMNREKKDHNSDPGEGIIKKTKVCYFKQMINHPSLDKEIKKSIIDTLEGLTSEGHTVEAEEFDLIDYIVPAYYLLTTAEASSNLSRFDGIRYGHQAESNQDLNDFYVKNRSEGFGKEVKRRIMLGTFILSAGYYDTYFTKAQKARRILIERTKLLFDKYDAIILPTSPTTAFKLGENEKDPVAMYLADIFTVFANLTGIPAISIPLFKHSNGLPFGIQIMTNKNDEKTLFTISDYLMKKKVP